MALKGYTKQLYVDGVLVACITNITTDITQPTNEVRHKGLRNIKGLTTDQIDEQSGTFQISGIFTDDTSNIVGFVDWLQGKLIKSVRISDGQNFGDRALFFDALCETDSETDTDLLKFDITLKSTGEITQGVITPPSLFTFYTNKVGTIFIQATGDNSAAGIFTDGFGNTLTMPYTRQAGDSEIIYMRGENAPNGLADFKTLTAANNSLYGNYDFSQWTSLENANLEGNNLDSATFVDGQFNTGTLNVINSFVQGPKFTQFITAFDTAMSTPRSSILDVGTIDDPLLLDPGDTTGTYAAIQSLTVKGWLISVVSNKLFTATIGQSTTITPNADLSAVGSLLYTLNDVAVSNITFNGSSPSTFNVNQGDVLKCWYANPTNDLFGLDSLLCSECGINSIILDVILLQSSVILKANENELLNVDQVIDDIINSSIIIGNYDFQIHLFNCLISEPIKIVDDVNNIRSKQIQIYNDYGIHVKYPNFYWTYGATGSYRGLDTQYSSTNIDIKYRDKDNVLKNWVIFNTEVAYLNNQKKYIDIPNTFIQENVDSICVCYVPNLQIEECIFNGVGDARNYTFISEICNFSEYGFLNIFRYTFATQDSNNDYINKTNIVEDQLYLTYFNSYVNTSSFQSVQLEEIGGIFYNGSTTDIINKNTLVTINFSIFKTIDINADFSNLVICRAENIAYDTGAKSHYKNVPLLEEIYNGNDNYYGEPNFIVENCTSLKEIKTTIQRRNWVNISIDLTNSINFESFSQTLNGSWVKLRYPSTASSLKKINLPDVITLDQNELNNHLTLITDTINNLNTSSLSSLESLEYYNSYQNLDLQTILFTLLDGIINNNVSTSKTSIDIRAQTGSITNYPIVSPINTLKTKLSTLLSQGWNSIQFSEDLTGSGTVERNNDAELNRDQNDL